MLPVMLLGTVVFKQKYSAIEYLAVGMITIGIWAFFNFASEKKSAAAATHNPSMDHPQATMIGIGLSMLSLLCDGITGSGQDHLIAKYSPSSELLMFGMNKWAVIELFFACFLLSNQGLDGFFFLQAHPDLIVQFILFGLVSAMGQFFIFHMVTVFGALCLSITTSTRKFFTILASVIYFNHALNITQWLAVAFVFGGLGMDIAKKAYMKNKKQNQNQKAKQVGTTETETELTNSKTHQKSNKKKD